MHLRMDIAEDVRNTLSIKFHCAGAPRLVETQVKAPAAEQRKDIVKERVLIWELNTAADRNYEQAWDEGLVFLYQALRSGRLSHGVLQGSDRRKPHDDFRVVESALAPG